MTEKLSVGHKALVRLMQFCGPRSITERDIERHGLRKEFEQAKSAKLIVSAGYECSAAGDEWLDSAAGRSAFDSAVGS